MTTMIDILKAKIYECFLLLMGALVAMFAWIDGAKPWVVLAILVATLYLDEIAGRVRSPQDSTATSKRVE